MVGAVSDAVGELAPTILDSLPAESE